MNYLKELEINSTRVSQVQEIAHLKNLRSIFADNTKINVEESRQFTAENKATLLVFQSEKLKNWWYNLSTEWQAVFRSSLPINTKSLSNVQLHQISRIESLDLNNKLQLVNLTSIRNLFYLKQLKLSGTQILDLNPLANLKELEHIECANNPIIDLKTLMSLTKLKYLDISNIPIKNFEQIQFMTSLETLICPGIQVKNLKNLENLVNLKQLECYNTGIKNLNPLKDLPLVQIKCYNTNLNQKRVGKFRLEHPGCKVVYY